MKNTQSGDVVLNRLGKGIHITCSQTRLYRDNVNMYRIMELIFFQREQSIKWIRRKNTLLSLWNMSVINLKQCDARLMHTILSVMQHFIMLNGNNHTRSSFCSINHFFFFFTIMIQNKNLQCMWNQHVIVSQLFYGENCQEQWNEGQRTVTRWCMKNKQMTSQ